MNIKKTSKTILDQNIELMFALEFIAGYNIIKYFKEGDFMSCNPKVNCTCTYTSCSRHGKCCECIAYHKRNGEVLGCLFSEAGERTYDRSVENFYNDYKNR